MNLQDCFRKRLLRKDRPDPARSRRSFQVSKAKLEHARKAYENGLYDASLVLAYTSMFHAARALLFRDGIVEKSHVCLVEYLREYYARRGRLSEGLVNTLDRLRVDRHEAIYGLEVSVEEEQAHSALEKAQEFIRVAEGIASKVAAPRVRARARGTRWRKDTFPDAGEATFAD